MAKTTKTQSKKRVVKVDPIGKAFVTASFNNIIISLTNNAGQVVSWLLQVRWGLKVLKRILLMQLKWQQQIAQRLHTTLDYARLRFL